MHLYIFLCPMAIMHYIQQDSYHVSYLLSRFPSTTSFTSMLSLMAHLAYRVCFLSLGSQDKWSCLLINVNTSYLLDENGKDMF